ncbi:MAG: winged helix-turn-helix domain-containing protein [Nocardioidaceae bacterium]
MTITKQEKIRRDLRSKIAEGRYPVGCRLPSYAEMERHYGVGTNVCQGAILDLEAEGLVQSQRGVGKFVLAQPVADSVPVMPSAQVRPEEALMSVLLGIRAAVDAALEHLESLTAFPPHRAN